MIDWLESNGEKEHNMLAHIASIQANKKKATVRHGRMASHQASTQKKKKKKKKREKERNEGEGLAGGGYIPSRSAPMYDRQTKNKRRREMIGEMAVKNGKASNTSALQSKKKRQESEVRSACKRKHKVGSLQAKMCFSG